MLSNIFIFFFACQVENLVETIEKKKTNLNFNIL